MGRGWLRRAEGQRLDVLQVIAQCRHGGPYLILVRARRTGCCKQQRRGGLQGDGRRDRWADLGAEIIKIDYWVLA